MSSTGSDNDTYSWNHSKHPSSTREETSITRSTWMPMSSLSTSYITISAHYNALRDQDNHHEGHWAQEDSSTRIDVCCFLCFIIGVALDECPSKGERDVVTRYIMMTSAHQMRQLLPSSWLTKVGLEIMYKLRHQKERYTNSPECTNHTVSRWRWVP